MKRPSRRSVIAAAGAGLAAVTGCITTTTQDGGGSPNGDQTGNGGGRPSGASVTDSEEEDEEIHGVYAQVYEEALPSVALLQVLRDSPDPFGGRASQGSGFVYDGDHLVTNQHVVEEAEEVEIQFTNNEWTTGAVLGTDVHSDLAAIEVEDRPEFATALDFAGEPPIVGQEVIALGNPLGFDASVSRGIISGVNRSLEAPGGFAIPNAVQTDAALNPGNSGGPLVNLDGEVVAVVSAGAGEGIGFGISAALSRRVIPALIENGEFEHSFMGVSILDVTPRVAEVNDLPEVTGVMLVDILDGGPAEDADLRAADDQEMVDGLPIPVGGDVIVALDDEPIVTSEDLSTYLALETDPGDTIDVTVVRDGEEITTSLTLVARSDVPEATDVEPDPPEGEPGDPGGEPGEPGG